MNRKFFYVFGSLQLFLFTSNTLFGENSVTIAPDKFQQFVSHFSPTSQNHLYVASHVKGKPLKDDLFEICLDLLSMKKTPGIENLGCYAKEKIDVGGGVSGYILQGPSLFDPSLHYLLMFNGPKEVARLLVADDYGDEGHYKTVESYLRRGDRDKSLDVLTITKYRCPD